MTLPMLQVNDLHVSYGVIEAVHGVSLNLNAGKIVSVIGPNGAGKTTLLSAIMGLLPSVGTLRFNGADLTAMDVEARVEAGLCLVPETRELFGELTVLDNLRLGSYVRRLSTSVLRSQLQSVYHRFPRLAERKNQRAGTLSGGERQMLAIGRALMASPRLLMLDEPSLGLAPLIVREILAIVSELRNDGVSILLVEQNARAALQISDFGYVLETGTIAVSGNSDDLIENQRIRAAYLGGGATATSPVNTT